MKKFWVFLKSLFKINCTHSSANKEICKYCPDCGKKIAHKWVVVRCRLCGHYRKPLLDSIGKIKPVKKYCFFCGSNKWEFRYYYDNYIPDKMKLIAIKKIQTEDELINKFGKLTEKTKVWVTKLF